jgi:hypothetical protein
MSTLSKQSTPDSIMSFDQPQNLALKTKSEDTTIDRHRKVSTFTSKSRPSSGVRRDKMMSMPLKKEEIAVSKPEIDLLHLMKEFPNFEEIF